MSYSLVVVTDRDNETTVDETSNKGQGCEGMV